MGMCELSAQGATDLGRIFLKILIEFAGIYIRNWKRVYTERHSESFHRALKLELRHR